ncbi:DUF4349 domain-containing protein [Microbacterium trichothecenolyticum]|uniref:DUF4349 domain-containing protein n=1 Tax=Microbacterium trichothecenolyticum TaxID=69370 RepID=A0ABU0TQG5_MICTR|nr:DUF4349 domain-containing protein [Microbacterium trichothecenolyticum]MDQ1121911.1 hypothetical protein [Microbacterium trichothecenolyticum]
MTTPTLPTLSDDRVDALETTIFARIGTERAERRRRRARIGGWSVAAAAVVLVAAMVGPAVVHGGSISLADQSAAGTSGSALTEPFSAPTSPELRLLDGTVVEAAPGTAVREVIADGSVTLEVSDVPTTVRAVSDAATSAGGYVESSQVGATSGAIPIAGDASAQSFPADASTAWIRVRVPVDALTSVMDGLSTLGTVTASKVTRSDVTDQTVDLRARITAAEASVARLTELMSQAGSVADLIAAESALADRQAQLDADRQQLALLESQVAMSSLTVQVMPAAATVAADPAGFGDGLVAGWNGLVTTLNGVVIGLGFLLPWLAAAGLVAAVVWVVRRARRRRARGADT